MYYVRNQQTGSIVYLSRFAKRARKYLNSLRGGLTFTVERG